MDGNGCGVIYDLQSLLGYKAHPWDSIYEYIHLAQYC